MNDFANFEFEPAAIVDAKSTIPADQWRILRRLHIPDRFNNLRGSTLKRGLVIDAEATGLSIEQDDVIQLAMLPFAYEVDSGRITDVYNHQAFEALREPAVSISEEASIIIGITDEMVAGQVPVNHGVEQTLGVEIATAGGERPGMVPGGPVGRGAKSGVVPGIRYGVGIEHVDAP